MIKHRSRIVPLLCVLCMLITLCLPVQVFADSGTVLTVNTRCSDVPVQYIRWRIFRVGSRNVYGGFDIDPAYAQSGVSFSDTVTEDEAKAAAEKFLAFITENEAEPDFIAVSDENGAAKADVGTPGIFFVYMLAADIGEYHYTALPAIVEVKDGGSEVIPKMESEKATGDESGPSDSAGETESGPDDSTGGSESGPDDSTYGDESSPDDSTGGDESLPDESEVSNPDSLDDSEDSSPESRDDSESIDSDSSDDTSLPGDTSGGSNSKGGGDSTPERIPQTGQLWWPVPMLAFIGLVLIALGLRVRSGKGGKDE